MDWGAFFNAASPGINAGLGQIVQHQNQVESLKRQQLAGILEDLQKNGDPETQKKAINWQMQVASGKYDHGKIMKEIGDHLGTPIQTPAITGAPAPAGGAPGAPGPEGPAPAGPAAPAMSVAEDKPAGEGIQPEMKVGGASLPASSPAAGGGGAPAKPAIPAPPPTPVMAGPSPAAPGAPGKVPPSPGGPGATPAAAPGAAPGAAPEDPLLKDASMVPEMMERAGAKPPAPIDRAAIAKEVAGRYGLTPEQLEDPNFRYTNRRLDPHKQAIWQEYNQRLQQEETQAHADYRAGINQHAQDIRSMVTQLMTTRRAGEAQATAAKKAEEAEKGREHRQEVRDRDAQTRAEAAAARAQKAQLRTEYLKEVSRANNMRYPTDDFGKMKMKDPAYAAQVEQQIAERIKRAQDLYGNDPEIIKGLEAGAPEKPGAGVGPKGGTKVNFGTSSGAAGEGGGKSWKSETPVMSAKQVADARAALTSGGGGGGAPDKPLTNSDHKRAQNIFADMQRRGLQAKDLDPGTRDWLLSYYRRVGGPKGAAAAVASL